MGLGARDVWTMQYGKTDAGRACLPTGLSTVDEKAVVFHSLSAEDMQEAVKVISKPLIASLADKGIELEVPG